MRSIFFDICIYSLFFSLIFYVLAAVNQWKKSLSTIAFFILLLSAASGVAFIAHEWIELERPPFVSSFEAMVFLSVVMMILYLIFERIYKVIFAGPFATLLALVVLGYATLFRESPSPLMPALRNSFWLTIHVMLCFISYAAFFLSFVAGILHLVRSGGRNKNAAIFITAFTLSALAVIAAAILATRGKMIDLEFNIKTVFYFFIVIMFLSMCLIWPVINFLKMLSPIGSDNPALEEVVHRSIMFGFPFLGLGILTGAVWANEAWGRYWGWDAKETWSLITWLIYFLYIHFRFVKGWRGTVTVWFSVIGFYSVIFTFFGVNYLLSGLHSYL